LLYLNFYFLTFSLLFRFLFKSLIKFFLLFFLKGVLLCSYSKIYYHIFMKSVLLYSSNFYYILNISYFLKNFFKKFSSVSRSFFILLFFSLFRKNRRYKRSKLLYKLQQGSLFYFMDYIYYSSFRRTFFLLFVKDNKIIYRVTSRLVNLRGKRRSSYFKFFLLGREIGFKIKSYFTPHKNILKHFKKRHLRVNRKLQKKFLPLWLNLFKNLYIIPDYYLRTGLRSYFFVKNIFLARFSRRNRLLNLFLRFHSSLLYYDNFIVKRRMFYFYFYLLKFRHRFNKFLSKNKMSKIYVTLKRSLPKRSSINFFVRLYNSRFFYALLRGILYTKVKIFRCFLIRCPISFNGSFLSKRRRL